MADTWTPVFDLSTPEKVAVFTKTTETAIADIIAGVQRRARSRHMSPRLPAVLAQWFAQPCYHAARRTAHFRVEDSCIGCDLCARKCPVQAIRMENGRPVWVQAQCVLCLGACTAARASPSSTGSTQSSTDSTRIRTCTCKRMAGR